MAPRVRKLSQICARSHPRAVAPGLSLAPEPDIVGALEVRMPRTDLMPNGVSSRADKVVYLVVDRVGSPRDARHKTKVEQTDIETIISNLIAGQFNDPLRVVAFNTLGHWSKDVSKEVAKEIQARCDIEAMAVPEHIRDFVLSYTG